MDKNNYYENRNIKLAFKLQELLADLPLFCREFFVGIENTTSALTKINYAYDLRIFFDYLLQNKFYGKTIRTLTIKDLEEVEALDIEYFISSLTAYKSSDNTIKTNKECAKSRKLAAIRTMFKYFFNKDKLSKNISTKVSMPKKREKEIVRLSPEEVEELLNIVYSGESLTARQKNFHRLTRDRDVAIVSLMLGTGIRISELVGLNLNDINLTKNLFKVTRKGGNEAVLYFSDEVRRYLYPYIENRKRNTKVKPNENALFLSLKNTRISPRTIEDLVAKYTANLTTLKKITPHKFRSTFGTLLYRNTKDIYIVADILGHKDVNTTKKHYAAIDEDMRKVVRNVVKLKKDEN